MIPASAPASQEGVDWCPEQIGNKHKHNISAITANPTRLCRYSISPGPQYIVNTAVGGGIYWKGFEMSKTVQDAPYSCSRRYTCITSLHLVCYCSFYAPNVCRSWRKYPESILQDNSLACCLIQCRATVLTLCLFNNQDIHKPIFWHSTIRTLQPIFWHSGLGGEQQSLRLRFSLGFARQDGVFVEKAIIYNHRGAVDSLPQRATAKRLKFSGRRFHIENFPADLARFYHDGVDHVARTAHQNLKHGRRGGTDTHKHQDQQ